MKTKEFGLSPGALEYTEVVSDQETLGVGVERKLFSHIGQDPGLCGSEAGPFRWQETQPLRDNLEGYKKGFRHG